MLRFLLVKYISLALTSARSLLLAALLGPTSFGVLGTLVVVQQSLSYAALGMREGLTVKLAQSHGDASAALVYSTNALLWGWGVGASLISAAVLLVHGLGIGNGSWVWVGVVACLSITNEMLININRDRNRLVKVALLEVAFNLVPLTAAVVLLRGITVTIALQALAIGILLSIMLYAPGRQDFQARSVRGRAMRELLTIGIPMALVSFATTSLSSVFVFAANAMRSGKIVGLLIFGNSLCVIVLYGLNMVSWAATSRSMRQIHAARPGQGTSEQQAEDRVAHLVAFLRLGVVIAPVGLLCLKAVFAFVLRAYAGSEVYAIYLCLVQSYGLLLYTELNFLAVKSRSLVTAIGYGIVLALVMIIALVAPGIGLVPLLQLVLLLMLVLSVACIQYCRRLGFAPRDLRSRLGFLLFPPAFAGGFGLLGTAGAVLVAAGFLVAGLSVHKGDVYALFARTTARVTGNTE